MRSDTLRKVSEKTMAFFYSSLNELAEYARNMNPVQFSSLMPDLDAHGQGKYQLQVAIRVVPLVDHISSINTSGRQAGNSKQH